MIRILRRRVESTSSPGTPLRVRIVAPVLRYLQIPRRGTRVSAAGGGITAASCGNG